MAKSKKGFETYSNDGLESPIELSDEQLEEARRIVEQDLEIIKKDIIQQLSRIESFIKSNGYPIPRTSEFVNWFFYKKKIYQTGKSIPEITDEEMLEYIEEYNTSLTSKLKIKTQTSNFTSINSMNWIKSDEKLLNLHTQLISKGFICSETPFENFKIVFSDTQIESISNKIIWLKVGKNKKPNKKSISDFINILTNRNYIEKIDFNITKILSYSFTSTKEELKFTNSNLAKNGNYSEHINEIEAIIKCL